jgi:AbrB family looped-hinge helix DNA binding protein
MAKKKKIDYDKLLEAIRSGQPSTEIMKKFDIKTSAQLKSHYMDAMVQKGEIPGISRKRGGAEKSDGDKNVKVSKRGSIAIPKEVVENYGFNEGDQFVVRKTKSGISLRKI